MRIVLDLQGAQSGGCYRRDTLSLALAIARNRGGHEVLIALNDLLPDTIEPIRALFDGLLPQENIRVWHAPEPASAGEAGNTWRREIAGRIREAFLASLQPDIVHVPGLPEAGLPDDENAGANFPDRGAEPTGSPILDARAKRIIADFEKTPPFRVGAAGFEGRDALRSRLIKSIAAINHIGKHEDDLVRIARAIAISFPDNRGKQLFVDVSAIVQVDCKTGIQRVTRSILKEFLDNPPDGYKVEPVYATPSRQGYRYARHYAAQLLDQDCAGEDEPVEYCPGDIFLGLDLQHRTLIAQHDFLKGLWRDGVKIIFVVYDLLPILMPHVFALETGIHKKWLEIVTGFDGAVCISRAVADELIDWLEANGRQRHRPFKINWFHLGADIENSVPTLGLPAGAAGILDRIAGAPTFLMVGTVEPRKGQQQTLDAFERLWARGLDINLVIVGNQGWKVEGLVGRLRHHPELGKRLFWPMGISDEYLEKVYAASACLVAASEGEGFGLPLIEAARHNLPIIARDIPVFREIAGEHAFYFDGLHPDKLASAVESWLALAAAGGVPQSSGIKWLTWAESAEQLKSGVCGHDAYKQWLPQRRSA